jgi:hypothetical protein
MEKQTLKSKFYSQLYKWSVSDAYREASNDFPFLKTMNDYHISHTLEIVESFSKPQQIQAFVALTKYSYKASGEFLNIDLTSEESKILKVFQQKREQFPLYKSKLYNTLYVNKNFLKVPTKKLKNLLSEELNPILGNSDSTKSDFLYLRIIENCWSISTLVSFDTRSISYSHILGFLPSNLTVSNCEDLLQKRVIFSNAISLPRWLGFKSGAWFFMKDEDPTVAAKAIARSCSHFLNAFPTFVDGLVS